MSQRLDAYLSQNGLGSRSEVRRLIRQRKVKIGNRTAMSQSEKVDGETVYVRGEAVQERLAEATLILNKPRGHSCSHNEREAPLVDELIPEFCKHLGMEPVGRLDRDTTGLLLITSDGQLLHRLIHPKKKVPKRYRLAYTGELSANAVQRCAEGFQVEDENKPYKGAELIIDQVSTPTTAGAATMILTEGRFHQVKRMIAHVGGTVVALHRDRLGDLALPEDLKPGEARLITPEELEQASTSVDDSEPS